MSSSRTTEKQDTVCVREAVGIFPDDAHLMAAIDDLELAEFARQDISVLGTKEQMQRAYRKPYRNPVNLQDDPRAPRSVHIMPEEQSLAEASLVGAGVIFALLLVVPYVGTTGDMAVSITGLLALMALGALAGYGLARWMRYVRMQRNIHQIEKGGLLLWVNTPTRELEMKAQSILTKHGAHDVHVNEVIKAVA